MSAIQDGEHVEAEADEAVADERGRGRRIMDEVRAAEQAHFDRLPMVARCGLCDWTFEGDAGAARSAQFEHRKTHARGDATNGHEKPVKHVSQGTTAHDRREALQKMATPRWTRDQLIERMRAWADEHGQPPTSGGWQKHKADGEWPTTTHVQKEFGSWSAGITAAGLNGVPTGGPQRPARVVAPKPAPAPAAQPLAVVGTLTVLAQAVDQAQLELDAAIARHADAVQALRDALEAT